jgi:hypothetical protein
VDGCNFPEWGVSGRLADGDDVWTFCDWAIGMADALGMPVVWRPPHVAHPDRPPRNPAVKNRHLRPSMVTSFTPLAA